MSGGCAARVTLGIRHYALVSERGEGNERTLRLTPQELNGEVHDAWLDLDSVTVRDGVVAMALEVERLRGKQWVLLPARLTVPGSIHAIEDDEGVGRLPVNRVIFSEGLLRLECSIPGRVIVATSDGTSELQIGRNPVAVKRRWRWRPLW